MRYLLLIFSLLGSAVATAQVDTVFTLISAWGASSQVTDSTFTVSATHPVDQLGQGFLPTNIQVGYYAVDAYGRRYIITAISSADFGSSSLTVKELQDNNLGPSGVGLIYRKESDHDRIPVPPGGNTGLAPATLARLHIHNVVNGGGGSATIDSAEWATLYALQDSASAIRTDFPDAGASLTDVRTEIADSLNVSKLDSVTLSQDSILIGWIRGVEVSRDTIAGTGGGGGSSPWTTSGSDIYYNTGGVVVGATSTAYSFESNGESRFYNDAGTSSGYKTITKFQRFESGTGNAGFTVQYLGDGTSTPGETLFFFPGAIDARFTTYNDGDGVTTAPSIYIEDNTASGNNGSSIGINTATPRYTVEISANDAIRIPSGSTAQRPVGSVYGLLRGNIDNGNIESWNFSTAAWDGLAWESDLSGTSGSIFFSDGTGLAEDNADLFWNSSTNEMRIGDAGNYSYVGFNISEQVNSDLLFDIVYPDNGGIRFFSNSTSYGEGPSFQAFGRNESVLGLAGQMYFDYGSIKADVSGRAAYFRNMQSSTPKYTTVLTLDEDSEVGINTAAPENTLHVAGGVRIETLTPTPTRLIGADADGDLGEFSFTLLIDSLAANGLIASTVADTPLVASYLQYNANGSTTFRAVDTAEGDGIASVSVANDTATITTNAGDEYYITGIGGTSGYALTSLTADGTTMVDFQSRVGGYFQIDMSSTAEDSLTFSNPATSVVPTYRLHFQNVTANTDTVTFPANVYSYAGDTLLGRNLPGDVLLECYYDGASYWCSDTLGASVTAVADTPLQTIDSPLEIDSLFAWYRADSAYTDAGKTTLAGNLDPVYTWADLSGNGYDLIQPTGGSQPNIKVDRFNGQKAIDFIYTNNDKFNNASASTPDTSDFTVFVALKRDTGPTTTEFMFDVSTGRLIFTPSNSTTVDNVGYFDGTWKDGGVAIDETNDHVITWLLDDAGSNIRVDGSSVYTGSYTPKSWGGTMSVGGAYNGTSQQYNGYIAEIIVFERALTADEITQVENYMNTRYAIY